MIKSLYFDKEMILIARGLAEDLGSLKNSITKGAGNIAGYLGELAVARELGISRRDTFDYDMLYKDKRLEVKTKRRTVKPLPHYDVSVAQTSGHQMPWGFVFVSLEFRKYNKESKTYHGLENVWLVGCKQFDEFWSKAILYEKGDIDSRNNFKTLQTMYNMPIHDLDDIGDINGTC